MVATSLVAACDLGEVPTEIDGRLPYAALPEYAGWWDATEACSGIEGELSAIEWILTRRIQVGGTMAFGLWRPPHEIVIVQGFQDNEFTVRHEMLHDLLRGDPDHGSSAWATCELDRES